MTVAKNCQEHSGAPQAKLRNLAFWQLLATSVLGVAFLIALRLAGKAA